MFNKYKTSIPNILTLSNLSFGVLSIVQVIHKNYTVAALFIILGALVDRYDGKVARALNVSSEIGKELDSLSDLITFGVAPGLLIFSKYGLENHIIGILSMLFYIISGCFRLARYNTINFDGTFSGVPITICGCALALFSLINMNVTFIPSALIILFGYLMISNIKLKKL